MEYYRYKVWKKEFEDYRDVMKKRKKEATLA